VERDEEFTGYVTARWAGLVRAAILLGCSRADAEDLVQTTLVRCFVSWPKVSAADDRDAYVYRMLLNARHTSRRRRWWAEQPAAEIDDHGVTSDAADQVAVEDGVRRALAALEPDSRAVVVLRYYADLSERQTADVLGIPAGTVKSRLSRALDRLALDPNLADLPEGTPHD
jgi:RNA polymerase sigma-70 factor (sigma-E family)